jgi:hypothetical protein
MRARHKIIPFTYDRMPKNWYYYCMSEKNKKILAILYVVVLTLGFFFVRYTLSIDQVDVITKGEVELKPEIKNVNVTLDVNSPTEPNEQKYELTTADSVYDLLQAARKQGAVYFEVIEYSNSFDMRFLDKSGTIVYESSVFLDGENISQKLKETKLQDGQLYTLRLVKK